MHTLKNNNKVNILSILLESGHVELLLSIGLVGTANRKFRETVCHNIAKLLGDTDRKVETEP